MEHSSKSHAAFTWVVVVGHPYDSGTVLGTVGPFASKGEADQAVAVLHGAIHPDCDLSVKEVTNLDSFLALHGDKENDDLDGM